MTRLLLIILVMVPAVLEAASPLPRGESELQRLEKASGGTLEVLWNKRTHTPMLLTGALTRPSAHAPEWVAREFLKQVKSTYGMRDPDRTMRIASIERTNGKVRVTFQQLLFDTPVWGDWLIVDVDQAGVVRRVEGVIHPNLARKLFNRPKEAAVSAQEAAQLAIRSVRGSEAAEEPDVRSYYLPTKPGTPLIYVVQAKYGEPERVVTTIVHALTGRIIEQQVDGSADLPKPDHE